MKVDTSEYEWAHGKRPRGRGTWAFFFDGDDSKPFFYTGKYSEAKVQAQRYAATIGSDQVSVGS